MNRGILLVLSGYLMWGCFPIYWALLNHVNPSEVLVHRILWSIPVLFTLVYFKPSWQANFRESITSRKELLFLFLTATLITINWGWLYSCCKFRKGSRGIYGLFPLSSNKHVRRLYFFP